MSNSQSEAKTKSVRLEPLQGPEFEAWLERAVRDYATEKVRAGNWAHEEALSRSRQEFAQLLPQGPESPGQHLFSVREVGSGKRVGMIWFNVKSEPGSEPYAWIYDVVIDDELQNQGYGRAAMLAVEEEVRKLGLNQIKLHVFGDNQRARALYEKLGYKVTNVQMAKRLSA
jgi:ribosomal protein S18 acetylase RimI-like enzyme